VNSVSLRPPKIFFTCSIRLVSAVLNAAAQSAHAIMPIDAPAGISFNKFSFSSKTVFIINFPRNNRAYSYDDEKII